MAQSTTQFKPVGLFYTPESMEELMQMIERLSGSEKAIAMQFAMHTWNLTCKLVQEGEDK